MLSFGTNNYQGKINYIDNIQGKCYYKAEIYNDLLRYLKKFMSIMKILGCNITSRQRKKLFYLDNIKKETFILISI